MADFANDDIISSAGGDAAGTYSYPKTGQVIYPGNYFLSVMGTWDSNTIAVRAMDRSGNYVVPNDSDGAAMTALAANFAEIITIGSAGLDLVLAGSGSQELTVTLERVRD